MGTSFLEIKDLKIVTYGSSQSSIQLKHFCNIAWYSYELWSSVGQQEYLKVNWKARMPIFWRVFLSKNAQIWLDVQN